MRLFSNPMSSNSRRAVMTALHLERHAEAPPVEIVLVDLAKGAQRQPDFLRLNPSGRVPVLEDEGFFLSESHAIMTYLCEKAPKQTLIPKGSHARALVNQWMFWCSHHWTPAVSVLNWENLIKPMIGIGEADPREVKRGEGLVTACGAVLDAHLAGRTWLVGDGLTAADIAVATPLMSTQPAKLPVKELANVQAWFARVRELDAWKATELKPVSAR